MLERVIWTAIPCGTPDHPYRLSALATLRVEGTGRIKVRDLTRLRDWPQNLHADQLSVRVDGRPVAATIVAQPRLELDSDFWLKLFDSKLDVDLIDLGKNVRDAQRKRTPVVARSAQSTALFKAHYGDRLADQAQKIKSDRHGYMKALGQHRATQDIESWNHYLDEIGRFEEGFGNRLSFADGEDRHQQLVSVMRYHEVFHSRPPLEVYPPIERDERDFDLAHGSAFVLGKADTNVDRTGAVLLPHLGDKKDHNTISLHNRSGNIAFATADAPLDLRVFAALGDHVSGDGIGYRLRPGVSMDIVPDEDKWHCESVTIDILDTDDDAVLYARHVCSGKGRYSRIRFRFVDGLPDGFHVTIRSLEAQIVEIEIEGRLGEYDLDRGGKVFRRESNKWMVEDENRHEFHRQVARVRSYPGLMRRLGLVVDFDLPADKVGSAGSVRVVPTHSDGSSDLCLWTRFVALPGRMFLPANRLGATTPLREGFLANNEQRSRFKLTQLDGDAAAMKNLQQARSQLIHQDAEASTVSLEARGHPDQSADLATLKNIGYALCDLDAAEDTKSALERFREVTIKLCTTGNCPELPSVTEDPNQATVPLFAEDLLLGYRVDVKRRAGPDDTKDGPWRSLCERSGRYYFPGTPNTKDPTWEWVDEGVVSQGADEVRDPKAPASAVRQSQSLFRWDGWSLVVPRPGKPMGERNGQLVETDPPEDVTTLRTTFKTKGSALPRLRMGRRYSFRLRAVDLAGNSLSLCEANKITDAFEARDPRLFNSGCYERVEPLLPPVLVPLHEPGPGEGNDQLVVREGSSRAREREWLLLPPGAASPFVELHGVLDDRKGSEAWRILKDRDGSAPEFKVESRGSGESWIQDTWLCKHGGFRVPYLPDPMLHRALFRQSDPSGIVSTVAEVEMAHPVMEDRYPERITGRRIRLRASSTPRIRGGVHLEVALPPGRIAKLHVASCPESFDIFGILAWCHCETSDPIPCDEVGPAGRGSAIAKEDLERAACAGDLGLLTPSRELTLVHAVERPLLPSGRKTLEWVTDRKYRFGNPIQVNLGQIGGGEFTFNIAGDVVIDRPSTGKLDVHLRWNEPVDIPELPDLSTTAQGIDPFQVSIPMTTDDYVTFSERAPSCTDGAPTPAASCEPLETYPVSGPVRFHDGKHRYASLSFDATSRFVDFYEKSDAANAAARFRRSSDAVMVHFPARVEPASPTPIYMVPTFRFTRDTIGKGARVQRQGGVRIFLARDWFSSGANEQLAIVFSPSRTANIPKPLDDYLSIWGADPLWEPIETDQGTYDRLMTGLPTIEMRPALDDVTNAETRIPNLITPLRLVPSEGQDVPPAEDIELAIAAFTPRLDKKKNLWFVDVDIKAPTYFTFLRLGLARYQPYAEVGRHLSPILPAVMSQLVPDCSVTVVPLKKKRCWEITVVAPATPPHHPASAIHRKFEVLALSHRQSTSRIPSDLETALPATELHFVSNGDGDAKWQGTVDSNAAGHCPQFLVVEKQSWASGGCRIVGCVEVRR